MAFISKHLLPDPQVCGSPGLGLHQAAGLCVQIYSMCLMLGPAGGVDATWGMFISWTEAPRGTDADIQYLLRLRPCHFQTPRPEQDNTTKTKGRSGNKHCPPRRKSGKFEISRTNEELGPMILPWRWLFLETKGHSIGAGYVIYRYLLLKLELLGCAF